LLFIDAVERDQPDRAEFWADLILRTNDEPADADA